jgi:hypothetical protein
MGKCKIFVCGLCKLIKVYYNYSLGANVILFPFGIPQYELVSVRQGDRNVTSLLVCSRDTCTTDNTNCEEREKSNLKYYLVLLYTGHTTPSPLIQCVISIAEWVTTAVGHVTCIGEFSIPEGGLKRRTSVQHAICPYIIVNWTSA